jgi:hypothetical protein
VGEAVRGDKHARARGEDPDVKEADYVGVVAEIKKKIVPGFLFVCVGAHGNENESANRIGNMDPSEAREGVSE